MCHFLLGLYIIQHEFWQKGQWSCQLNIFKGKSQKIILVPYHTE